MAKHQAIVSLLLAATVLLTACARSNPQVAGGKSGTVGASGSAQEPEDLNRRIVDALQRGRYADAALFARQAKVSRPESDFAVGEIILQGYSDDSAAQPPRETIEEGLALIEAAALAGHQQAVSALAATFHTGLSRRTVDGFLVKPDAALNQCWEDTKESMQMARSCIDMRKKH